MKVIFLTMVPSPSILNRGIYTDLLRRFVSEGNKVYVVFPRERRFDQPTELYEADGATYIGVWTFNLQKSSTIEKGIGQVLVEGQYKRAIKKYLSDVQFDLILYSTPPITFPKVISFLKKKNPKAKTYLLLKDIFPQNAVDLGMMKKTGIKGILYEFFRNKEKKLYRISDYIGCMSPANVKYLLNHNSEIEAGRVEVAPNSVDLKYSEHNIVTDKNSVRAKYELPSDKPIFIYGGNLGKPQGIPFLLECLKSNMHREDLHFVIVGTGTELPKLKKWAIEHSSNNISVMDGLPKQEYDELVRACDVGLIFLDHRFTIPNFPSRLLTYLENKMPVLCATDPNTDMGRIAAENGFGYWCESNSVEDFTLIIDRMMHSDRTAMGEKGYEYLRDNYLIENTYNSIVKHV